MTRAAALVAAGLLLAACGPSPVTRWPPPATAPLRLTAAPRATGGPTWRLLGTGGAYGWYFSHAAIESDGAGRIFHHWASHTWAFTPATNTWSEIPLTGLNPGWRENFGSDYDATNRRIWWGPGAPGDVANHFVSFAVPTSTYTDLGNPGACGANAAYAWHQDTLYCWGGYSDVGVPLRRKMTAPDGPWEQLAPTGQPPQLLYQTGSRFTSWRAGVNRAAGYLWQVADSNEFYKCPIAGHTCTAWTKVPTTGTKPTSEFAVYQLDEGRNTVIGFAGMETASGGGAEISQTYVLDLSTNVWSLGPGPTAPHPPSGAMSLYVPLYDRMHGRVLLLTSHGYAEVWWYDAGASPVVDPPAAPGSTSVNITAGPPPPTTYRLTTQTAKGATGTTTGDGLYAAGAPVALTATPAPGSSFAGWNPAPCAANFAMPASALTCTATFTSGPPPAACTITPGQFTACLATPVSANASPLPQGGAKDQQWTYDSTRGLLVVGFGDFSTTYANASGQNSAYTYNPATNSWALWSAYCHAAGQESPSFPTDKGPFIYAAARDAFFLWNPQPYPDKDGQVCTVSGPPGQPTGSIIHTGIMRYDMASRSWSQVSAQSTGSLGSGAYDAVTDSALFIELAGNCPGTGVGGRMVSVELTTFGKLNLADLCLTDTPPWNGSTGGWLPPEQPQRAWWAWDAATRTGYLITVARRLGDVTAEKPILVKYERAANRWTRLTDPPVANPSGFNDFNINVVWDSVHGKVLWPVVRTGANPASCARVEQFLIYTPSTNSWTDVPVPFEMHAGTVMYSPAADALVMGGGAFCNTPYNVDYLHLWRTP